MKRMLDLFCGRLGWSKAFLARGWECVGVDLVEPPDLHCLRQNVPRLFNFLCLNVMEIGSAFIRTGNFDFICASSPCEQFSVHGMKHFHPNPPYPELGIKLFEHTRALCEASGVPYVMENVGPAENFVGPAVFKCGPFALWGSGVPVIFPKGLTKGMSQARKRGADGKRIYTAAADRMCSTKRKQVVATIPPELAHCVADYAERLLEQKACEVTP